MESLCPGAPPFRRGPKGERSTHLVSRPDRSGDLAPVADAPVPRLEPKNRKRAEKRQEKNKLCLVMLYFCRAPPPARDRSKALASNVTPCSLSRHLERTYGPRTGRTRGSPSSLSRKRTFPAGCPDQPGPASSSAKGPAAPPVPISLLPASPCQNAFSFDRYMPSRSGRTARMATRPLPQAERHLSKFHRDPDLRYGEATWDY